MSQRPLRLAVALNGYGLERYEPDGFDRDLLAWQDLLGLAKLAEEQGYEATFMPQQWGWEPTTCLAAIARETSSIGLATGVLPLHARAPGEIAMTAVSLQALSGGRFTLGLGSSLPIASTRSYVTGIIDALRGGPGYIPETDGVIGPLDLRPTGAPAVFLAALGPRMVSLAGEIADGVILNWCTPERVAEARAAIPARDEFTIAVYVRACLSHVDRQASEALKTTVARYVGLEWYARQFAAMGLGDEAAAAREGLDRDGSPGDVVPDRLLERTCVWGDRDRALDRLAAYAEAGADLVVVYPVAAGEAVSSLTGTLMAAAPGA
jgi:alkanesulfonate monooxygenase SsuD/methylene tetrahydromethanopterin reductase-like flavin-dependent oxidoreductase (luciferase family)